MNKIILICVISLFFNSCFKDLETFESSIRAISNIIDGSGSIYDLEIYQEEITIKVNQEVELPFYLKQRQSKGTIKLLTQDSSILEIISSNAGLAKGLKKGKTTVKIFYLNSAKEIKVNVEE